MIRPLFPFYGSKWRDARRYPAPCELVIEPFAGSAGYSLWHEPPRVHLADVDPIVAGVWRYLIAVSEREVLALPDLEVGEDVDDLVSLPPEARWLIGFWLNRGSAQPKRTRTAYSARTERQQLVWGARARARIAAGVPRIRHWTITQSSYADLVPTSATWFVDPPYVDKGRHYRYCAVDYGHLARWTRELPGEVIVCEQQGATWLPFEPLASIKSTRGRSEEVVWTAGVQPAALF